jgi:hypothetical protein
MPPKAKSEATKVKETKMVEEEDLGGDDKEAKVAEEEDSGGDRY